MGLEHELEDILEDGVEKGIVKAVEKLIDKGLIKEIVQITINTIEENILILVEKGISTAVTASISALHKYMEEIGKVSKEESLSLIKNFIFNLIKNMYGDINRTELEQTINEIKNVDKLCVVIQIVIESQSFGDLISCIKNQA